MIKISFSLAVCAIAGCTPYTWSQAMINGHACGASIETACGILTIDKMADASGPIFAIRAKNDFVRSNHEYLKVAAFRNGTSYDMLLHTATDSMRDLMFTAFSGGPGTVFVGLGTTVADSFHIDIMDCFSRRGSSCFDDFFTIVPCKKRECGKCLEQK
jgi:hypothetical protein